MTIYTMMTSALEDCEAAITRQQPAHWTDADMVEALNDIRRALPPRLGFRGPAEMPCQLETAHAALIARSLTAFAEWALTDAPITAIGFNLDDDHAAPYAGEIREQRAHCAEVARRLRATAAALTA